MEDIFTKRNIKNETVIIKSDNASTQYKNQDAFFLLQQIANKYNVTILRIYGAAGHGEDLIDAMSRFGESKELDQKRMEKKGLVINGCMIQYMLIFKPRCNDSVAKEYVCDCKMCLSLSFDKCENTKDLNDNSILEEISSVTNDSEWFCDSDKTINKSYILEFVDVPSFVAVLSNNLNEPVYSIKVEEKGIAECELRDRFGHVILVGEPYFKVNYLKKIRSRKISKFQFKLLPNPVYLEPDEVYQPFVETEEKNCI